MEYQILLSFFSGPPDIFNWKMQKGGELESLWWFFIFLRVNLL